MIKRKSVKLWGFSARGPSEGQGGGRLFCTWSLPTAPSHHDDRRRLRSPTRPLRSHTTEERGAWLWAKQSPPPRHSSNLQAPQVEKWDMMSRRGGRESLGTEWMTSAVNWSENSLYVFNTDHFLFNSLSFFHSSGLLDTCWMSCSWKRGTKCVSKSRPIFFFFFNNISFFDQ